MIEKIEAKIFERKICSLTKIRIVYLSLTNFLLKYFTFYSFEEEQKLGHQILQADFFYKQKADM